MLNAKELGLLLANGAKVSPQKWADVLSSYLIANTEFKFTWIGFDPKGRPDSTVVMNAKFIKLKIVMGKFKVLADFCTYIQIGVAGGMVMGVSPWSVAPVPFGVNVPLVLTFGYKDNYIDEPTHKAGEIIKWVLAWKIPVPLSGTRVQFIGSGSHISTK